MDFSQLIPETSGENDTVWALDDQLNLVWANEAWRRFAGKNGGEALLQPGANRNLLDNLSGSARLRWRSITQLLLGGHLLWHEEEFPHPSTLVSVLNRPCSPWPGRTCSTPPACSCV